VNKLSTLLIILILAAVALTLGLSMRGDPGYLIVHKGNDTKEPINFVIGKTKDTICGMLLERLGDTVQIVEPNGKTWFFDDIGCAALWLKEYDERDEVVIWVYSRDGRQWADARKVWYSRTDLTPMHYGFAPYEQQREGLIPFEEMMQKMWRGENLTNPYIRNLLKKESTE
jgi:copper chaperone NosL